MSLGGAWSLVRSLVGPSESSFRRRLANGVVWSIAGAGLGNAFSMLANVVCARVLGATHFGELAIVLLTTNLFTTLSGGGLGLTATKYIAEFRTSDPGRAGKIVGMSWVASSLVSVAVALVLLLISPWLSQTVLHSAGLNGALKVSAAILLFAAVNGAQTGALSGLEAFRTIAIGNLIRGTGIVTLVSLGAAMRGLNGALAGYVIVGAAMTVFYQAALRRECARNSIRISYSFGREDLRILGRFTVPVVVAAFAFPPAAWWANVLLANRSGYAEAGVFNAVLQWQMAILFLSTAIGNIGLPMLSNVWGERDASKYKRYLAVNFALTTLPAVLVAVPLIIGAPLVMRLYGRSFEHGAAALALIGVAAILSAMNITVGQAIWSLEAPLAGMLLAVLRGGALVLAAYFFAGKGATGLAAAYLSMGAIQTAVQAPFMARLLRRKFAARVSPVEAAA